MYDQSSSLARKLVNLCVESVSNLQSLIIEELNFKPLKGFPIDICSFKEVL